MSDSPLPPLRLPLTDTRTYTYRLLPPPSRIPILLIRESSSSPAPHPRCGASLCVGVGAVDDTDGVVGQAHLLEHVLFHNDEWTAFLSRHAGHSNALTEDLVTTYFYSLNYSPETFRESLVRFGKLFSSEDVEEKQQESSIIVSEIEAVDSEFVRGRLDDRERVSCVVKEGLFGDGHPLRHFVTGNRESLGGVSASDMAQFWKSRYGADLMSVVVYGGIEPVDGESDDGVWDWIREAFSGIPCRDGSYCRESSAWTRCPLSMMVNDDDHDDDAPKKTARLLQVVPLRQVRHLQLLFPIPLRFARRRHSSSEKKEKVTNNIRERRIRAALHLMDYLLTDCRETSLYGSNGLISAISTSRCFPVDGWTLFSINLSLTPAGNADIVTTIELLFAYLELIRQSSSAEITSETTTSLTDDESDCGASRYVGLREVFEEMVRARRLKFDYRDRMTNVEDICCVLSRRMQTFPPREVVCGDEIVLGVEREGVREEEEEEEEEGEGEYDFSPVEVEESVKLFVEELLGKNEEGNKKGWMRCENMAMVHFSTLYQQQQREKEEQTTESESAEESEESEESEQDVRIPLVEKWNGAEYFLDCLPEDQIERFRNPSPEFVSMMSFPPPNHLIPFDVSLREVSEGGEEGSESEYPTCLHLPSSDFFRVFYKRDVTFEIPKTHLRFRFSFLQPIVSVRSRFLMKLVCAFIVSELCPLRSIAERAGSRFRLSSDKYGLTLFVEGFSEVVCELAFEIVQTVFFMEFSGSILGSLLTSTYSELRNELRCRPLDDAVKLFYFALNATPGTFLDSELVDFVDGGCGSLLSVGDVERFYASLEQCFVSVLCVGNTTREELRDLVERIEGEILKAPLLTNMRPIRDSEFVLPRIVRLQPGKRWVLRRRASDEENEDSAVVKSVSVGCPSLRKNVLLQLVQMVMKTPFFNRLRQEENLGYVVRVSHCWFHNVMYLRFCVVGNRKSPGFMHGRIDTFLDSFPAYLEQEISESDFAVLVEELQKRVLKKPTSLREEVGRYWSKIDSTSNSRNTRLRFGTRKKVAGVAGTVSLADLRRFFQEYFVVNRRELTVEVFGRLFADQMEEERREDRSYTENVHHLKRTHGTHHSSRV